jgi:hypothetical protein
METILETHKHHLRFKIDSDAPIKYIKMWNEIKKECENNNKHIVEQIKEKCKIVSNKNLPYLNRCEGGLGGDNNILDKQIRFRIETSLKNDNDILLLPTNTETQKWTYVELDDIIRSFTKVLNNKMKTECTTGCIEMINNNAFNDNYLESDSE